jgi:hypothetical protein
MKELPPETVSKPFLLIIDQKKMENSSGGMNSPWKSGIFPWMETNWICRVNVSVSLLAKSNV